jgi:dihydroflavonol-4-reductase
LPRTLVTGATGFLGWHLARALCERGHQVRALVRPGSSLRELSAEPVTGDVRDFTALERAVSGCDYVFHAAADYRLWTPDPRSMYQSNVDGTRNVLSAAERAGVKRIVYTSTVGCIGIPASGIGDEESPVSLADMSGHYKRSKWLAEQIAIEKARAGLPVVIVNPTAPVGDHDFKPTPTGKIVLDFLRNRLNAYVDTGLNLVAARDVAEGHLLAAERGRSGERYILGCENLTLQQILTKLAAITARPAPHTRIPYSVAFAAGAVSTAFARFTGKPPLVPLEAVRMSRKKMFVTHGKAARELGYAPGPVESALERSVAWFRDNGYY